MNNSNLSENATFFNIYNLVFNSYNVANYFDWIFRILSLLIHILYVIIVVINKKLQTRAYIYTHHVNIVSLAYILHFVSFLNNRTASYGENLDLKVFFCTLSEISWSLLAYMRTYSILLLALYRYCAVCKIKIHRLINTKLFYIYLPIIFLWLGSIILTIALKFSLKTTHSVYYCTPGYSDNFLVIIINQFLVNIISNVIPVLLVIVLYAKILQSLKKNKKRLNKYSKNSSKQSKRNEYELAKQFIFINFCTILSSILSIVINLIMVMASYQFTKNQINKLDQIYIEVRPALRTIFIFFQTCLPILSIIYNPEIKLNKKIQNLKNLSISVIS